jgi:Protein of unknown function (DUF3723)
MPKPVATGSPDQLWFELANLAFDLGFESESIRCLRQTDPDERMGRVHQTSPPFRILPPRCATGHRRQD